MKSLPTPRRVCLFSIFYCLLTVLFGGATAEAECGIHGRVLAMDEGGALKGVVPGAVIEFRNQALQVAATATTDAHGYYQVDLPPGIYYYKVQANGYRTEDVGRGIQLELSEGRAIHNFSLTAGTEETSAPPAIAPSPVGTLTGRVFEISPSGEKVGIPGATVALRKRDGTRGIRRAVTGAGSDAQSAGHYSILLDAGDWTVSAAAPGFETFVETRPVTVEKGGTTVRDFD